MRFNNYQSKHQGVTPEAAEFISVTLRVADQPTENVIQTSAKSNVMQTKIQTLLEVKYNDFDLIQEDDGNFQTQGQEALA